MNKRFTYACVGVLISASAQAIDLTTFPDGSPIPGWFHDTTRVDPVALGRQYVITDYGVLCDSTIVQTEAIQRVIDMAAEDSGGVIVVPEGTYMTGSLFFRPGTHLHVAEGGKLKGIDAIAHYEIVPTRLEGQTIDYFAALVNADHCDGFTISGPGMIDGNGFRFYDEFWLRRRVNPKCTNLEALRPRLIYISNSNDVTVSDITLVNSGFWTNHLYNCNNVKYLGVNIYARTAKPQAPSTDALDLDVCSDVLVSQCRMSVGDDAVCCKGGKGTWVDTIPGNGGVHRVIIDDCDFGATNAGITFGSEAWDCSNAIINNCRFDGTSHIVLFKMRPDTPQQYRDVLVQGCTGRVKNGVEVQRWTQFYNPSDRDPMPPSGVHNVTVRDVDVECTRDFLREAGGDYYTLSSFRFEDVRTVDPSDNFDEQFDKTRFTNSTAKNVEIIKSKNQPNNAKDYE